MEIEQPQRVVTRERVNLTQTLCKLAVGESIVFRQPINHGSIRTIAASHQIRIALRTLDDGSIEITRRPDKIQAKQQTKKLYDL